MNKEMHNLGVRLKCTCLVKVSCFLGILLGKTYSIHCKRYFSIVAESNIWPVKSWSPISNIHEQNHQCAVNMKWNAFGILHWASVDIITYYNTEPNPNIPKWMYLFQEYFIHDSLVSLHPLRLMHDHRDFSVHQGLPLVIGPSQQGSSQSNPSQLKHWGDLSPAAILMLSLLEPMISCQSSGSERLHSYGWRYRAERGGSSTNNAGMMVISLSCWNQQTLPLQFFLKQDPDSEKCQYSKAQTEGVSHKECVCMCECERAIERERAGDS